MLAPYNFNNVFFCYPLFTTDCYFYIWLYLIVHNLILLKMFYLEIIFLKLTRPKSVGDNWNEGSALSHRLGWVVSVFVMRIGEVLWFLSREWGGCFNFFHAWNANWCSHQIKKTHQSDLNIIQLHNRVFWYLFFAWFLWLVFGGVFSDFSMQVRGRVQRNLWLGHPEFYLLYIAKTPIVAPKGTRVLFIRGKLRKSIKYILYVLEVRYYY